MNDETGRRWTVVVAGASGFIGQHVWKAFTARGWRLIGLTRRRQRVDGRQWLAWDPSRRTIQAPAPLSVDAVVNLAGENIGAGRWTKRFKQRLYQSRIDATQTLVEAARQWQPRVFVQLTGIGYYGYDRGDEWLDESSAPGEGFLADLSKDWEAAARPVTELGTALFVLRAGVVLGADGGMIKKLMPLALLNLLSPLGPGHQWMSWIHIDDLVEVIRWAIEHPNQAGTYNACALHPVRHKAFIYHFVSSMNKAVFLPRVPRWVLRLAVGEMERALTGSLRIDARRLNAKVPFRYSDVQSALRDLSPVNH